MKKRILFYGGTFNPPHKGHRKTVEMMVSSGFFNEVVVFPCGPRPENEKGTANILPPSCRATMCDLEFGRMSGVKLDLSDLRNNIYTRTYELVDRMSSDKCEVWVAVGADIVPDIRNWEEGNRLWREANFAIICRPGYDLKPEDMPPNSRIFRLDCDVSSSQIRHRLFNHQSIEGLVSPAVGEYIKRYRLYSGSSPLGHGILNIEKPRALMVVNESNAKAVAAAAKLKCFEDKENPNMIWVFGGDGTMFRANRRYWPMRLPFVGFNFGTEGFLFGERTLARDVIEGKYDFDRLRVYRHPLLEVELKNIEGDTIKSFAFNDAWMERQEGQMAWIKILVNKKIFEENMKCDSVLVATPGGSTSYARVLGATCMYLDATHIILAASGVYSAPYQRSWDLNFEDQIELVTLDPGKRPVRAFVDGVKYENVLRMRVEVSRIAAVELGFHPDYDITKKVREIYDK